MYDEKDPAQESDKAICALKDKEAERLAKHIKDDDFVITLEIGGKELDTLALADTGLRKGRIERGVVHRTGRRKALPHPVTLALNVMVEDVRGRVLIKKFGIFGVKQPCAVKFCGDVGADGPQQLFQAGGGIGRGAQAQPRTAT